ncbi:MAG: CDP-glycerol glycerophosphotransferase, TagB/SpsB family [Lachnoclostridium sp.]|jgi:CDP-glycerol glycerophosphotransferase
MRNRIKRILPKQVLEILKLLRYYYIVFLFHIFHLFPISKTKIVICNVWGFGDNAKYVAEELARRKANHPELDIIFITNHPKSAYAPKGITVRKTNTPKAIFALATARIWVDNNRKENYIRKRKGQFYIQTWHGGIALKKIEKDYKDRLGHKYVANAKRDSAMTDLYISNSNFCTNMYRKSFWYQGEILECGSPRNDILLSPSETVNQEVRKRLGIKEGIKIAIYAPTYREGEGNTKPYELDFEMLLKTIKERFGGNWVIAVRLHPLVSGQSGFISYNNRVINATYYRDIYELMSAADLLITDYSNLMFEFSFMKKPVFLYASDVKKYEKERGFYFEYRSLPYQIALTDCELMENIKNFDYEKYQENVEKFLSKLAIYENGNASKCVADRILKTIYNNI